VNPTPVVAVAVSGIIAVSRALSSGPPPALDALGTTIPDSVLVALRANGMLRDGDAPTYAYIPANGGTESALVLTDSLLVYQSATGPRRVAFADANIAFNFKKRSSGPENPGTMIVTVPGRRSDTVYSTLGGLEFSRLRTSMLAMLRTVQ
jgi:hypothetical protein